MTGTFDPAAFTIVTSGFQNAFTGTFSIELRDSGKNFYVVYTAPVPAPTVASVAPFIGPTSGGNTVIITGTNFAAIDPGHLASAVKFGAANAVSYTVNSASQITAVAPVASPSTVNVVVTNPGGSSSTVGAVDNYTFATPSITSVVINGGTSIPTNIYGTSINIAGQQSIVEQIAVTFNQRVLLDSNMDGTSQAFNITSLAGSMTASVAIPSTAHVAVNTTPVLSTGNGTDGYTQYILTFAAGAGVNSRNNAIPNLGNTFTTLTDGLYQLNTTGAHVHSGVSDTTADRTDKFWALYGAVNDQDVTVSSPLTLGGNKLLVDGIALGEMYQTFGSFANVAGPPAYNVAYDSNLDGIVDGIDLGKMYANFGTQWLF